MQCYFQYRENKFHEKKTIKHVLIFKDQNLTFVYYLIKIITLNHIHLLINF